MKHQKLAKLRFCLIPKTDIHMCVYIYITGNPSVIIKTSHPFLENRTNGANRGDEYKSTMLHLVNRSRG